MNGEQLTLVNYIWFALSGAVLIVWLWRSRGGRKAFVSAPGKRHQLGGLDVLLVVLVYLMSELLRVSFLGGDEDAPWEKLNLSFLALIGGQLLVTVVILFIAARRFEKGLPGFGLSGGRLGKTVVLSVGYFFVATGLTFLMLAVTVYICRWAGYVEVQKHIILEKLALEGPWLSKVLMITTAAFGAPVAEELIFRGMLQNYLIRMLSPLSKRPGESAVATDEERRSFDQETLYGRWTGIALAAVVFAMFHADWQHGPALVVLGVCLGYLYERYGNLLIPILVHSIFNILPLTLTVLGIGAE